MKKKEKRTTNLILLKVLTYLSFILLIYIITPLNVFAEIYMENLEINKEKFIVQQQRTITGNVTDANGNNLPGVTILIKGTSRGTTADHNGNFTLSNVPENATLQFSFIGMLKKEVFTGNQNRFDVSLQEELLDLDELIVIGYGSQKKINLTGSVEAVKGEKLIKNASMSTSLALQGLVPGMTVTSSSGQPGKEGDNIRIRGIGTVNDNNPLVLIDGVEGSINGVNSHDIENISVLKDAASSSIYGSRAANGVILITTKRAETNKFNINFTANFGLQKSIDFPDLLGAIDYMYLYDLASSNDTRKDDGSPGGVTFGKEHIENYRNNMSSDPYQYPNTNWADLTFRSFSPQQEYNLNLTGGTERLKSAAFINIQNQTGIFPDTYLKRYNLRINNDYIFSDRFSVGIDMSGRYSVVSQTLDANFTMKQVRRTAPIYSHINEDGTFKYIPIGSNTYANSREKNRGYDRDWFQEGLINLKAAYIPFEVLRIDFSYAPKFNFSTLKNFSKPIKYYNSDGTIGNVAPPIQNLNMQKTYRLNNDLKMLVNFNKRLENQNISALLGFQQLTNYWENLRGSREGSEFEYDQLNSFPLINQVATGAANEWALQSYFGRVNYNFREKYLLEANVRYDGSSRFARGYKWGLFPSLSAGWRFSEENFIKKTDWLSNGKLRISWGQLGNQEGLGSNYPFSMDINLNQPIVFNQIVSDGYAASEYAMRDITWETTEMTNFGLDISFLNNQLGLVFDYYRKTTSNILLNMDIPDVMGYGNRPKQNAGKVENKGWDLSVIYYGKQGDFNYNITASLSDVNNKILDMKGIISNFGGVITNRENYPLNSIWGLQADGLFSSFEEARAYNVTQYGKLQGGDIKYVDQLTLDTNNDGVIDSGDGIINSDDYIVIGNTIPRYTYSFDFSMNYKEFDLGLFFQGVGKRDSYINEDLAWAFNNGGNVQKWQKEGMWQDGQINAAYPRLFIASTNNTTPSSFWVQNAAYLRLKNLQLGYTLPRRFLMSSFINNVRFYISGHNIFTIHHMPKGNDPEQLEFNADRTMPIVKTYSFGFNLNF